MHRRGDEIYYQSISQLQHGMPHLGPRSTGKCLHTFAEDQEGVSQTDFFPTFSTVD